MSSVFCQLSTPKFLTPLLLRSVIFAKLEEISYFRNGIVLLEISLISLRFNEMSDFRDGIVLHDMSLVLLRLLKMSNLFCEISSSQSSHT